MNINRSINTLKSITPTINPKYRAYADTVINLFKDRKIEKTKEAEKLLYQLGSRGKAPQAAIQKITEKYSKAETVKGKLSRPTSQTFFISGDILSNVIYKSQLKKTGEIKESKAYELPPRPFMATIKAKNKAEAEQLFVAKARETFNNSNTDADSNTNRSNRFLSAVISSIYAEKSFKASSENDQLMKAAAHVDYSFVPADTSLLKNNGFCVLDQFIGIYGEKIKHLTKEYFVDLCYKVRGEQQPAKKEISALDVGIEGIEDDDDRPDAWKISDGVSPDMLRKICEIEDISHYCFDITRKCFSKYVSKHRNFKALIYYCINNHMYWISDEAAASSLIKKARDVETKIKSNCIKEDITKPTENIFKRDIYENTPISKIMELDNATII